MQATMSDSGFTKWPNVRKSTLLLILILILASHGYTTKVAAFFTVGNDCATAQDAINMQQDNFYHEILRYDEESPVIINGYGLNGFCSVPFSDRNATQSSAPVNPNGTGAKCDLNMCLNFKVPVTNYNITEESSYIPHIPPPLLAVLLQSMGTQRHTPVIIDTIKASYDYIIVGAGSAGSVLAARLSEIPCITVLLLEAGKPPPKVSDVPRFTQYFQGSDIDWGYYAIPQKHTAAGLRNISFPFPRGKTLGGSSTINHLIYVRGNRKDYDNWVREGATGWSYDEVLPYFKKLEDNRDPEYVINGYHNVGGPLTASKFRYDAELRNIILETALHEGYNIVDSNGRQQTGFYPVQGSIRDGQRCSTAKAYLVAADHRKNLDIVANAFVRKVVIRNRQAEGVVFDFQGKRRMVRARGEVILSAGAVNTPQILMLSGIGPQEQLSKFNIPVIADLPVGKNFHDHVGAVSLFELDSSIQMNEQASDPRNILEYIYRKSGPLSTSPSISVMAFLNRDEPKLTNDFPEFEIGFLDGSLFAPLFQHLYGENGTNPIFGPYLNSTTWACFCFILHPKSRGEIKIQSANPEDPPIIDPNYLSHTSDLDTLVEALKTCRRIGTSEPMRKVGSKPFSTVIPGCESFVEKVDQYLRCMARSFASSIYHGVGTAKMGRPEDTSTVLDPQLRVKTVRRLRVVDASVMPLVPSGNTNVPVIMVAEKAADIIKEDISCDKTRIHGRRETEFSPPYL